MSEGEEPRSSDGAGGAEAYLEHPSDRDQGSTRRRRGGILSWGAMAVRTRVERDYYRILELAPGATDEEIRRAYRRLALRWHPDRNPGEPEAEEHFKAISEAYAVLVDPAKRRQYDRSRQAGAPHDFRPSRDDLFRDLFANPAASAIFEELAREFERMGMRVDRRYFHRTLFGGRAVVTGGVFIVAPLTPMFALFRLARAALRGVSSGGASETRALPRPPGLRDVVVGMGRWLLGLPPGSTTPSRASGGAQDLNVPLRLTRAEAQRGGRKRLRLNRGAGVDEVLVTIPPGIEAGTRLRLRGKGRSGPDSLPGDMYLTVEITDEGRTDSGVGS